MESFLIKEFAAHLRYHDLPGKPPALVFLHGLGSASSSYYPSIVRHAALQRRRTLLVDSLGFGYSDRPREFDYTIESQAGLVAQLLRHLDLAGSYVIGHSMGGSIAIALAFENPLLVSRLVLAEANLDPGPGFVSGPITRIPESEYVSRGHATFLQQVRTLGFIDYAGTLQAADPLAVHRSAVSLIAPRTPSFRQQLLATHADRTFLFGDENRRDPDVARLPQDKIRVAIIADSGHDMATDNPTGFANAIADAVAVMR